MCVVAGQPERLMRVLNVLKRLGLCDALVDVTVYAWDGTHHYVNEKTPSQVSDPLYILMELFKHLQTSGEIVVIKLRGTGYGWVDAKLYLYSLPMLAYSEFQDAEGSHFYFVNEVGSQRLAGTDVNVVGVSLASLEVRLTNYLSYFDKMHKVRELLSHVPSDVRSDPKKTWVKEEL